jgi:hypothetical protein
MNDSVRNIIRKLVKEELESALAEAKPTAKSEKPATDPKKVSNEKFRRIEARMLSTRDPEKMAKLKAKLLALAETRTTR